MNMRPAIVLRQMIKGREVQLIKGRQYRITNNGCIEHLDEGDWSLSQMSLNIFIRRCYKLSDHDLAKITEEIELWESPGHEQNRN